jgi:hypothetical protein
VYRTFPTCIALLFAFAVVRPQPARADYYAYTDANGAPVITNRLETVPKRYRAGMRVVKEDKPAPAKTGDRPVTNKPFAVPATPQPVVREEPAAAPEPPAPPALTGRMGDHAKRYPWLKPVGVVAGLLAGFLAVIRIAAHLSSPQLARVIYLAFFLGVFVFAYKSYAESLVERYFTIKTKIVSMFRKANVRQAEELNPLPQVPDRRDGAEESE